MTYGSAVGTGSDELPVPFPVPACVLDLLVYPAGKGFRIKNPVIHSSPTTALPR